MITTIHGADLDIRPDGDLRYANLSNADLRYANLRYANLREADLRYANLSGASLNDSNLGEANLSEADLSYADLRGADLRRANLRYANLSGTKLSPFQIVPAEGAFIAYKAVRGAVLKIRIPADALRTSSLTGRKCRASHVEVLCAVKSYLPTDTAEFEGLYNGTPYRIGEIVRADRFDPDVRVECTHGIHFFMTQEEAEDYQP